MVKHAVYCILQTPSFQPIKDIINTKGQKRFNSNIQHYERQLFIDTDDLGGHKKNYSKKVQVHVRRFVFSNSPTE